MKKYIDGINQIINSPEYFGIYQIAKGFARAELVKKDDEGGEVLRRKLLISNQIKASKNEAPIVRPIEESKLDAFISKMENEIFEEFHRLPSSAITTKSFSKFLKTKALAREEITETSYSEWLIDELNLYDNAEADKEFLKELSPKDVVGTINFLDNDVVIDHLSSDEIAFLAFRTLTANMQTIDHNGFALLMPYMNIESEDVTPLDFMVTVIEESLGQNFDNYYLPILRNNPNFAFASNIEDLRSYIEEKSDEIAGIESDEEGDYESEDSGVASAENKSLDFESAKSFIPIENNIADPSSGDKRDYSDDEDEDYSNHQHKKLAYNAQDTVIVGDDTDNVDCF